jgi:hypothetical protein
MRKPIIFLAGLLVMVFSLTSIQLPGMTGTVVQAATTDTPQVMKQPSKRHGRLWQSKCQPACRQVRR